MSLNLGIKILNVEMLLAEIISERKGGVHIENDWV
jgi:hypothetical protein